MLIACGVGDRCEPGARGTVLLQRVWPVLLGDRGEHEDPDERLAFRCALGKAEASAVRGVLDQRADPLERLVTLRRKVWSAGLVLELDDQLF